MAFDLSITTKETLADVESQIQRMLDGRSERGQFRARVASDRRGAFFKDIWAAMAVASGIERSASAEVIAWGLQSWALLENEENFALSYPCLIAIQRGARIVTDGTPLELDREQVKRSIIGSGGVIGTGARQRTVVELDPDLPLAARLTSGAQRRGRFFEFIRSVLTQLEIGQLARRNPSPNLKEGAAKGTILEFLYELHSNAFEHARTESNARFLRLQKHQYPHRDGAKRRVSAFVELERYIESQPERPSNRVFNLIEASVSDFGPGIPDGFLASFAGSRYRSSPRSELLDTLLHEQLSSKSSDPNAGLGIKQALAAAQDLDAFVSLRTAEFWLTMQGRSARGAKLTFRPGKFPHIAGTHWQLLLPDPTDPNLLDRARA